MLMAAALLVLVLVLTGVAVWLARALAFMRADSSRQLEFRNAEVDRRLQGLTEAVDRRLADLDTKVDRRLEHASEQTNAIHRQLGDVGRATAQLAEQAKDLGQLQQLLRPPKARGGFGELLLANLLADRLPPTAYTLQHTFRSGERVDAVIRVDKLVPVDAKFPLDNFERYVDAQDDEARQLHGKAFARDVKIHIDAIASKYIRPDEGTFDFAFMYLPSEAIYYELTCGKTGALLDYAHDRSVLPVSPSTLVAYLHTIVLGLKGMQIEQHAQEVMAYCAQLQKDFGTFRADFDTIGKHLGHARSKYAEAEKRLDRFEDRLDRATDSPQVDAVELAELPRALDAA
jgi:DNA recombination protein RmuC